jgi:hypothetical protein
VFAEGELGQESNVHNLHLAGSYVIAHIFRTPAGR